MNEDDGDDLLFWERATPEEDPGVVYLLASRADTDVLMFLSGPSITADPRELDLNVSVVDLLAVAEDPRVDLTTSREAVGAGRELGYWTTGPA